MKTTTLIDYLSMTVYAKYPERPNMAMVQTIAYEAINLATDHILAKVLGTHSLRRMHGRGSYREAYTSTPVGFTVFFGVNANTVLLEITGQGCETLRNLGLLDELIQKAYRRLTRLDVAVDLETDTEPTDFADAGYSGRFKSYGVQKSETGTTVYVGSRTSDRYAKIYRYALPHPRYKLLRCEFTYKKDYAKAAGRLYAEQGLHELAGSSGTTWGFEHSDWTSAEITGEKMKGYKLETKSSKTLLWLMNQCAPAFKKLCKDGTIADPYEFLCKHFIPESVSTERPAE
jgi:hypothetical protein